MRTLSLAQTNQLALADRGTNVRVKVDDGTGTFVDLTTLEGRNWFQSFEYGGGVDMPLQSCTIRLKRQVYGLNLAPLVDGSKLNQGGTVIDVSREFFVEIAVIAKDATPFEAEYEEIFRGFIDEIDWAGDPLTIKGRDEGSLLMNTFIEDIRVYGLVGGDPVEDVIQEILDDNINTPGLGTVTLFSENGTGGTPFNAGDSPGFKIRPYKQSKQPVLQALRRLAQLFGWDVKYRFQKNTNTFEIVLQAPTRAVAARGTLSLTGQPAAAQFFTVNLTAITARVSGAGVDEFNIGSTVAATVDNIVAALNAGSEKANMFAYDDPGGADDVIIDWGTLGTGGNSVVFTEGLSNATADGGGTLGGTRAGNAGKTTPDFTFPENRIFDHQRLAIRGQDIRNAWSLRFADPAQLDSTGSDLITRIVREDAASIAKYGRRFAEITEGATSQINTVQEAVNMVDSALADTREPDLEASTEVPYLWSTEEGDLYRFKSDGDRFDTDQDLAIVSFRHKLGRIENRTTLQTRGKPSGGFRRWLEIQGMPGIAPAQDNFDDAAAGNVVVTEFGNIGGIVVTYDDPRGTEPPIPDWEYTEIHVATGSGFTPDATTLAARGKSTRFEIGGLIPGVLFFIKIIVVDSQGNKALVSAEVQQAAALSSAFHLDPDTPATNLIPNGDFGQATRPIATVPPSGWDAPGVTWGAADDVFFDANIQETGLRSINYMTDGSGLRSGFIPVESEKLYKLDTVARSNGTTAGNANMFAQIENYDKDKGLLSTTVFQLYPIGFVTADVFLRRTTYHYFNTEALHSGTVRFIRIRFQANLAATFEIFQDRAILTRGMQSFSAFQGANDAIPNNTNTNFLDPNLATITAPILEFDIEIVLISGLFYGFDLGNGVFRVLEPGQYSFEAAAEIDMLSGSKVFDIGLTLNGVVFKRGSLIKSGSSGDYRNVVAATIDLVRGDIVGPFVFHTNGSSRNLVGGSTHCYFAGGRVE